MKYAELSHDRIRIVCKFVTVEDEDMCDAPTASRKACREWNCPLFADVNRIEPTDKKEKK